ncbi:MAG: LacI family DNA-binding transcriptional regulator [Anaerolineales bacterium]|nr:LacI family DNA-binding transcriptional regulator [Anaerolineales bacterium]
MNERATLKTIAKATGYSITTVSRALAGYDDVAEATRAVIQSSAQQLGYFPNLTARQLQKQRTDTIGIILPSVGPRFADPYFSLILAGIGDEIAVSGYDILISTRPPGPAELEAYRSIVEGQRVDGIVVIRTRLEDERIAYLAERGFPFVAFGRTTLDLDYPYIDEDGEAGTYELILHLAQLGHERIAYIAAPQHLTFGYNRLKGYKRALDDTGLVYHPEYVEVGDLTRRGGSAAAEKLLAKPLPPTAIVAANDLMALGTMNHLQQNGLRIGIDISVAGFDDIPAAEALGLTTLNQPIFRIGHQLSQMLLAVIEGQHLAEPKLVLKPKLLIRASVGPPA